MTLTKEMQKKVEENMGLVGKVISDKIHGLDTPNFYSYDDLFQIGCVGLCKAAYSDCGLSLHIRVALSGMKFATLCTMV